ncbi:phenylalanine/histidine ammonia-lyase [alpha proteobacterium BAL199]|jgi:histidine ammonia-lyase|nr:phenylalanine/histidine ammonia-lyase [alpha proteobacterium BAL199]
MTATATPIGDEPLTARAVATVARGQAEPALTAAARQRIVDSHATLLEQTAAGTRIYGVTTGLGAVADTTVTADDAERQRRVVLGRSVGVGRIATDDEVRAMMIARLAGFTVGRSGVSPPVTECLLALLCQRVHPIVPMTASLGEADLAAMAHIGSVVAGAGEARWRGEVLAGGDALAQAGITPPALVAKDGLALVSSNAASVGLGALAVIEALETLGGLIASAALSFEGFRANVAPLDPKSVALRPAPGQSAVAAELLGLLAGGDLMQPGAAQRLQDPLSFRCVASVYGSAAAALKAAIAAVELELNTSDDNPAVVPGVGVVPTANFDSTHLAQAFATLNLAIARIAPTIGMRTHKLLSDSMSGLPRFLSPLQNGHSGFAPVQKTASALMAEIQHAAMPMPIWVMPVADGVEDVATLALSTVEKTREIVARIRSLAAIELMIAAQACDLRDSPVLGTGTTGVHGAVRERVVMLHDDRATASDIHALDALIAEGRFETIANDLLTAV